MPVRRCSSAGSHSIFSQRDEREERASERRSERGREGERGRERGRTGGREKGRERGGEREHAQGTCGPPTPCAPRLSTTTPSFPSRTGGAGGLPAIVAGVPAIVAGTTAARICQLDAPYATSVPGTLTWSRVRAAAEPPGIAIRLLQYNREPSIIPIRAILPYAQVSTADLASYPNSARRSVPRASYLTSKSAGRAVPCTLPQYSRDIGIVPGPQQGRPIGKEGWLYSHSRLVPRGSGSSIPASQYHPSCTSVPLSPYISTTLPVHQYHAPHTSEPLDPQINMRTNPHITTPRMETTIRPRRASDVYQLTTLYAAIRVSGV
eukprot:3860999-Rhodomonas_salina.1